MAHGTPAIAGASESGNGAAPRMHERTGNGHGPGLWDLTVREYLIIVPLVAAILFLGIYPKPFLSRIEPSAIRSCAVVRETAAKATLLPSVQGSGRVACNGNAARPAAGWTGYAPLGAPGGSP